MIPSLLITQQKKKKTFILQASQSVNIHIHVVLCICLAALGTSVHVTVNPLKGRWFNPTVEPSAEHSSTLSKLLSKKFLILVVS